MKTFGKLFIFIVIAFIGALYWSLSSTNENFKKAELLNIDNISSFNFKAIDSVVLAASTLYKADDIKLLMQGEQYRKAWETPIKVPVIFLDSLQGGMEVLKKGGGKQTHSLKLESEKGIKYTLRSINKDPRALIPDLAKTLGLENIVIDGISAQHPYGAILVSELAKAASIYTTHPKIVFIPKQKILENYNAQFGNRLYLLEYETDSHVNWTNNKNAIEIIETDDLQKLKLNQENTVVIDKSALIRLRLFDFLIGDWDRHAKQYGWVIEKQDHNYRAIPLAGDRDNAFFKTEGIIPTILSNKNMVPELQSFEKEIDFMPGLVYPFDRYFLYNTSEKVFIAEAEKLQKSLTNKVIYDALNAWPKEIQALDGKEIIEKMISRRIDLVAYAKEFKKVIDKKGVVKDPLKGSGKLNLPLELLECFDCTKKVN
ncbi:hypothetical protein [Lacinutrix mariniflava]|uniref:hypothetical protein n=1 Tax=Lacinutrix mariniflava TaxID=342955 RepID=UPI0006E3E68E|nr:hypothetical protein [Lacinutrix mariniflava]